MPPVRSAIGPTITRPSVRISAFRFPGAFLTIRPPSVLRTLEQRAGPAVDRAAQRPQIPSRSNRKLVFSQDAARYRTWQIVETGFCDIKSFQGAAAR